MPRKKHSIRRDALFAALGALLGPDALKVVEVLINVLN